MRLHVKQVNTDGQFESLHEEWNQLLRKSAHDDITLTWEWLYTWWGVFQDDTRRLMILTVRDTEGRLVGIAPLQLRTVRPYFFLPAIHQLAFLAFGEAVEDEICSDYLNFIIERGLEAEVILAIGHSLANDLSKTWDEIFLDKVCVDSENVRQMRAVMGSHNRFRYEEILRGPCYFIPLPAAWDALLANLNRGLRLKYHRDLRRASAKGTLTYTLAQTPEEMKEGLGILAKIHQLRWAEKGKVGVFASKKFRLFHERFSEMALKNGYLQLRSLRLNGVPLAVMYHFLYNNKIYFYQSGIDTQQHKNIAPGMLLHGHCIQEAISRGIREYDFLYGETAYKAKWTPHVRNLIAIRILAKGEKMRPISMVEAVEDGIRNRYRGCKSFVKRTYKGNQL